MEQKHHRERGLAEDAPEKTKYSNQYTGFPGGSAGRVHLQCRRPRFERWVTEILCRREWLPTTASFSCFSVYFSCLSSDFQVRAISPPRKHSVISGDICSSLSVGREGHGICWRGPMCLCVTKHVFVRILNFRNHSGFVDFMVGHLEPM